MSLSMTLPVMPAVLSFSVELYTPVRMPVLALSGASTSGWTMFRRVPNTAGFPKKIKVWPGTRRACIHLTPLKKTISISPLSSETMALKRLTMLYLSFSAGSSTPFLPYRRTLVTIARTCTCARSG